MEVLGLTINKGNKGNRISLKCDHFNSLLYTIPSESSWVCSDDLIHAHALSGFFHDLTGLKEEKVKNLMQKWGIYHRDNNYQQANSANT
jgi:hypothetical protein